MECQGLLCAKYTTYESVLTQVMRHVHYTLNSFTYIKIFLRGRTNKIQDFYVHAHIHTHTHTILKLLHRDT